MAFKDIYDCAPRDITERELARFIWEYQQFSIDRLLEDRVKDRARIDELEDELERLKQSSNSQANGGSDDL